MNSRVSGWIPRWRRANQMRRALKSVVCLLFMAAFWLSSGPATQALETPPFPFLYATLLVETEVYSANLIEETTQENTYWRRLTYDLAEQRALVKTYRQPDEPQDLAPPHEVTLFEGTNQTQYRREAGRVMKSRGTFWMGDDNPLFAGRVIHGMNLAKIIEAASSEALGIRMVSQQELEAGPPYLPQRATLILNEQQQVIRMESQSQEKLNEREWVWIEKTHEEAPFYYPVIARQRYEDPESIFERRDRIHALTIYASLPDEAFEMNVPAQVQTQDMRQLLLPPAGLPR